MIKTPFPFFGGKSRAADLLWQRFGTDCGNYVEPFFGSGAVWINRPAKYSGWGTVNDLDGNVCNAHRSMAMKPEETAMHACHPVNECDLHARHLWLVNNAGKLAARLMADPEYCDPRVAGWWIWGACCWIRSPWCAGDGPWHAEPDSEGIMALTLGNGGSGVNRQLPAIGNAAGVTHRNHSDRLQWITEWFTQVSERLQDTRICCGDWERIMSVGSMTRNGTCAVLLDPPYSQTEAVYAHDSSTVAHDVRRWCIDNGNDKRLRVALCGHDGEHNELEAMGWRAETWEKGGGYQGADDRERIWFSPGCLFPSTEPKLFDWED